MAAISCQLGADYSLVNTRKQSLRNDMSSKAFAELTDFLQLTSRIFWNFYIMVIA